MNSKHMMSFFCAAALSSGVFAAEEQATEEKDNSLPVSAEFSVAFDSKFMSYGLVDNNDPILTPSAAVTFLDFLTFEVAAIFDMTKYGNKAGYMNRASRYQELDPAVSIGWSFFEGEWYQLDTSVGYSYEYHPRSMKNRIRFVDDDGNPAAYNDTPGADTQFVTAEIGLPNAFLEPVLSYERDIKRDNGTYLNLELGYTFSIIDGESEDDDPVLAFRPSVAQGFGNKARVAGYLAKDDEEESPLRKAGLMDTCVKGELAWAICDYLTLSGYVAYYDYVFDSQMREAARRYEGSGRHDDSYNFVAGLALTASF